MVVSRRWFVTRASAAVLVSASAAGGAQKPWRIGVLTPDRATVRQSLIEGLRQFGYVEGSNVTLDYRVASRESDYPRLADEVVKKNPDVIVVVTGRAALALKAATPTIPIVMATSADAVAQGLVASLARPGGNITGLTVMASDLAAKRLAILKEAVPRASRFAVLGCPEGGVTGPQQWKEVEPAAERLGLTLVPAVVGRVDQLEDVFTRTMHRGCDAVLVLDCSALSLAFERVVRLVTKARVPALYPFARFVNAGGLMSYGPDSEMLYRRAAVFVDKILKGAKPADLPVEQPTQFDFVINARAAKTLGMTLPPSLVVRASRVIE